MKRRTLLQAAPALLGLPGLACAQTAYPAKPIRYIEPFPGLAAAVPHVRSGRVRPLAVTGLQRHPQFKDLPTLDESGFKGFDAQQWYGVVGPAGMPAAIVKQLNETLATVLGAPDLREKLSVEAVEPIVMTPEKFGEFIVTDIARWTKLARERGIQLDS